MPFLDGDPDLTGTVYSTDDLPRARVELVEIIEAVDPAWLDKPVGPVGQRWLAEGTAPASFLIHLGKTLYTLKHNATSRSVPILREKISRLLRPPAGDRVFEEMLSELEVGACLAERIPPLAFEPLAPTPEQRPGPALKSPDYGARLSDGVVVCFEVTNVHFSFLDSWEKAMSRSCENLVRFIRRKEMRRQVMISVPVLAPREQIDGLFSGDILQRIENEGHGDAAIAMGAGTARLSWSEIPHEATISGFDNSTADFGTFGGLPGPASAIRWGPIVDGDPAKEAVVTSIRNSINKKRRQMTASAPYILIIRIANHRIDSEGIAELVRDRIFPNDVYKWLTGLAVFIPARTWTQGSEPQTFLLTFNENATHSATQDLQSAFS